MQDCKINQAHFFNEPFFLYSNLKSKAKDRDEPKAKVDPNKLELKEV